MTLIDAVNDFRDKITPNSNRARYCSFAPAEQTVGVIDLSPNSDGSRGIAFLVDRMIVKLGADAQQVYYRSIRVTEILPSYETPFEDELVIAAPSGEIRISDCGLNKFFLRQLINTLCRMTNTMRDNDREELEAELAEQAFGYYSDESGVLSGQRRTPPSELHNVTVAAAVQEIAAAKKAAMAELPAEPIEISDEEIHWISGKQPEAAAPPAEEPQAVPDEPEDYLDDEQDSLEDMTHDEAISYLLSSISEINSDPDESAADAADFAEEQPTVEPSTPPKQTEQPEEAPLPQLTHEPESDDIYIRASRRIRELCEDGRLTMEQVDSAVKEQLVEASERFSSLDISAAELPPTVKAHAVNLAAAAERLPEYFALGEDIAARVMFFMLYQMLSYTDRVVQTDETKQRLNYFFVRFGAAGIILSMLDAG